MKSEKKLNLSNPWHLLATGFGIGRFSTMPGTVGTLAAIPFFLFLGGLPLIAYLGTVTMASILGIFICSRASEGVGLHDHSSIVWDEFVGFWITMLVVPVLQLSPFDWKLIFFGFLYFRFFDVAKPWPVCWLDENVKGGWGVIIDDIAAGMVAMFCLWLTHAVFW